MNETYRAKVEAYLSSMCPVQKLYALGILSQEDYLRAEALLAEKYNIGTRSIYRKSDLQYPDSRVNMPHDKEVVSCESPL